MRDNTTVTWMWMGLFVLAIVMVSGLFLADKIGGNGLALMGVGLASILPGIGSSVAVAVAGEKAAGIIADDPEKFGRLLLLEALPGTQGIYGFLAAFLAINKIGGFSGLMSLTVAQGWQVIFACLPVALTCLVSAFWQGRVSVAGMDIVAVRPEESGRALVLPAMVETYAILGLLASILAIMFAIKV